MSSRVVEIKSLLLCFFISWKGGDTRMSVNVYALFTYALTAAISLLVIGVIVVLNKFLGSKPDKPKEE